MWKKWVLVLFSFCMAWGVSASSQQKTTVYKVDIKDEIGPKVWRLVQKSFKEATEVGAEYIVIDMNTYGGMVVYADSLRSLILNSHKPVWVFVNNNAASAGALISLACDKIYMREGANIGAATVVNQSGEAMPDKYQSYMRSMIRSTAQAHGKDTVIHGNDTTFRWKRDPHIAEAMVDQTIYIEGVTDTGKIVTFTPHEAMLHGYCDGMAENIEEVLQKEKVDNYTIVSYKPTMMDQVIGFLINPVVQGVLIMLIVGGLYFELQTPGIGFPLVAALAACLLYFSPLYLEGLASYWEIIAFILGIVLLLLEIFVIPGFGVAGISGIILIVIALTFAGIDKFSFDFPGESLSAVVYSLFMVISVSILSLLTCIWLAPKILGARRWAFALHAEQKAEEGYVGVDMSIFDVVGKSGQTITDLRPGGKVMVEGEIYDAVSLLGDYITKGSEVEVRKFQSGQVYVIKNEK